MQRISTDEVRARSGEFAAVVSKSEEMNKAIGTALIDMTAGLTNNMRQNLQIKTNKMCDDMLVLLSSLRRGKDLLDKVVIAYETADANLKKEVEDWVGDTHVSKFPGYIEHNSTPYDTLKYEPYIMNQCDYDGPAFGYGTNNGGCTATAWCIGLSMITGKHYDPTASNMWGADGAKFPGQSASVRANQSAMLSEAYNQLQMGKPSVFYANHSEYGYNGPHAVTIVGVDSDANPSNLQMSDFLVVDPWKGQVRSLAELGYCNYPGWARLITYGDISTLP